MIYIIDDDKIMQECIARACGKVETKRFSDAYAAMAALDEGLPDLIFLDVLLNGADGFTFLNELVSYTDTATIPIVVVSSLEFENEDLSGYGVVEVLDKAKMTPKEINSYVQKYAKQ